MKSPISWVGRKSRMIKKLLQCYPITIVMQKYLKLLFGKEPSKWEVLNDHDSNLMNFWWVVKNCPEQLIESFNFILISRETFKNTVNKIVDDNNIKNQIKFIQHKRSRYYNHQEAPNQIRNGAFFTFRIITLSVISH